MKTFVVIKDELNLLLTPNESFSLNSPELSRIVYKEFCRGWLIFLIMKCQIPFQLNSEVGHIT